MTVKVLIESEPKPDTFENLLGFLETNLPNVRNFDGCISVTVFFDESREKMLFDEDWASVEHHRKYFQAITESGVLAELGSYLSAPPEVKYRIKAAL